MSRMKAWIYRAYGGPEVLDLAQVDTPVPARGEVRLRVCAFALNPLDWKPTRPCRLGRRGPTF